MKKIIPCVAFAFLSCHHQPDNTVRDFIPGVYVKQSESEFSKAFDTLRVNVYDAAGNTYLVIQRTGFQVIKDGKLQPKQYRGSKEVAVLDESTHQLQEMQSGRYLTFSPENGTVLAGPAEYKKIP